MTCKICKKVFSLFWRKKNICKLCGYAFCCDCFVNNTEYLDFEVSNGFCIKCFSIIIESKTEEKAEKKNEDCNNIPSENIKISPNLEIEEETKQEIQDLSLESEYDVSI